MAAGAGAVYQAGVAVCAAVLAYENAIVARADQRRVQTAFGNANMVLSMTYLAFVVAEVVLS